MNWPPAPAPSSIRAAPDGKSVAYVRDHDVYFDALAAHKEHPVTTGGTEKKSHGLAEFVAQEEMDRFSGYWWSPDARFIAYEEADAGDVEVWNVVDPANPDQPPVPQIHPAAGQSHVKVRLGVVAVVVEKPRGSNGMPKSIYLAHVVWAREGPLTLTVQNRLQYELVLLCADPTTGKNAELLVGERQGVSQSEP